jgi:alpha-1,3-glucosyltransferase
MALWRNPKPKGFAKAVAYANLCGFSWGYHVHEKAALTVLIPLVLSAVSEPLVGELYVVLSTAAHVGMFPLLFQWAELPVRWVLAGVYYVGAVWGLGELHEGVLGRLGGPGGKAKSSSSSSSSHGEHEMKLWGCPFKAGWLRCQYRVYLAGFLPLEVYCVFGHELLFQRRLPFVPLMLTSLYCAIGIVWVWGCMAWGYVQEAVAGPAAGRDGKQKVR